MARERYRPRSGLEAAPRQLGGSSWANISPTSACGDHLLFAFTTLLLHFYYTFAVPVPRGVVAHALHRPKLCFPRWPSQMSGRPGGWRSRPPPPFFAAMVAQKSYRAPLLCRHRRCCLGWGIFVFVGSFDSKCRQLIRCRKATPPPHHRRLHSHRYDRHRYDGHRSL